MEKNQRPDDRQDGSKQDQERLSVLSRRDLLKVGGVATLAAGSLLASDAVAQEGSDAHDSDFAALKTMGGTREAYWQNDGAYFVQKNVDASQFNDNVVRARIEGQWYDFAVRPLDEAFFNFNAGMRKRMMDYMAGGVGLAMYNDAHNAAVGTYGSNRGDSRFTMNVAFKGMGWVPTPDKIEARTDELSAAYTADMMTKMKLLYEGYTDSSLWDMRIQGSLELYTTQTNETHSFLNQMVNPVSTICFLGDESYELRTIARLIHPDDPGLTDYEKKVVKYINFAHDFFHGGPDKTKLIVHNIGVIYYVIEEFDNSPWGATETAGGMKRVPAP